MAKPLRRQDDEGLSRDVLARAQRLATRLGIDTRALLVLALVEGLASQSSSD